MKIEKGMKIVVRDRRKELPDNLLAKGIVTKTSQQQEAQYVYLDTGYLLVVIPQFVREKASAENAVIEKTSFSPGRVKKQELDE